MAKYVVQWTARDNSSGVAEARRLTDLFTKWQPSPSATFQQFVTRVDAQGGFAVVETDNPADLLRDASLYGPWFVFETHQVMDVMEAFTIQQDALATLESLS
jgi:hypothetical protein